MYRVYHLGERGRAMDPGTSLLNSFYALLNRELPPEETAFSHRGPFYHQHLTEELRPAGPRSFHKFLAEHINVGLEKGPFFLHS